MFEARRAKQSGRGDEDVEVVFGDLVDSVLRSYHASSLRRQPDAAALLVRLRNADREPILGWLVRACHIMGFHEVVFYNTVLTLDRYCARAREALPMERVQKVLMGVICTVLKTCDVQDEVCLAMPLRELLTHLCRRQVSFDEILQVEHEVLRVLSFDVVTPTVLDFLNAFTAPMATSSEPAGSCPARCLANFLLHLSLFNAPVHYQYPPAVLAASAVYVALCSLRAAPRFAAQLLEDLALICPEVSDVPGCVGACAAELHNMWLEFANSRGALVPSLKEKFSSAWMSAALLGPPPAGALPAPSSLLVRLSERHCEVATP